MCAVRRPEAHACSHSSWRTGKQLSQMQSAPLLTAVIWSGRSPVSSSSSRCAVIESERSEASARPPGITHARGNVRISAARRVISTRPEPSSTMATDAKPRPSPRHTGAPLPCAWRRSCPPAAAGHASMTLLPSCWWPTRIRRHGRGPAWSGGDPAPSPDVAPT
eukprot:6188543-Pleurochrysis_carterae.AAC.9